MCARIVNLIDIQRQERAEPPKVRPGRIPPAVAAAFGAQPIQIEHDLNRPAVELAQIHEPVRGVFGPTDRAGQV